MAPLREVLCGRSCMVSKQQLPASMNFRILLGNWTGCVPGSGAVCASQRHSSEVQVTPPCWSGQGKQGVLYILPA